MLHFDRTGELKRTFLLTAVRRNNNSQLRIKALQEIAASRDPEAFDQALDVVGGWQRDERREGSKVMLQALVEKRIGRRDQATAWIWRIASYTSELHEEYAVQRWPETKRLLGLLVNSSGGAHARNARRLVHSTRKQDRRLSAALLAAARAHTPEAEEVLRGARTRMARKPGALSRELLRNFPRGAKGRRGKRRKRKGGEEEGVVLETAVLNGTALQPDDIEETVAAESAPAVSEDETLERIREAARALASARGDEIPAEEPVAEAAPDDEAAPPSKPRRRRVMIDDDGQPAVASDADALAKPKRTRRTRSRKPAEKQVVADEQPETTATPPETETETEEAPKPKRTRRPRAKKAAEPEVEATPVAEDAPAEEKPKRPRRAPAKKKPAEETAEAEKPKPKRTRRAPAKKAVEAEAETPAAEPEAKPKRTRARRVKPTEDAPDAEAPKPVRRTRKTQESPETEAA
jgi:ribonuclease E